MNIFYFNILQCLLHLFWPWLLEYHLFFDQYRNLSKLIRDKIKNNTIGLCHTREMNNVFLILIVLPLLLLFPFKNKSQRYFLRALCDHNQELQEPLSLWGFGSLWLLCPPQKHFFFLIAQPKNRQRREKVTSFAFCGPSFFSEHDCLSLLYHPQE